MKKWLEEKAKSFPLQIQASNALPKRPPKKNLVVKAGTLYQMESIAEEPNEEGSDMLVVS